MRIERVGETAGAEDPHMAGDDAPADEDDLSPAGVGCTRQCLIGMVWVPSSWNLPQLTQTGCHSSKP